MERNSVKKFCISVDGSKNSDMGFDLVFNELYTKGDFIIVAHVNNPQKDVPFEYQTKTIISKYETKLLGQLPSGKYLIVTKERSDEEHALATIYNVAVSNGCTALIVGFHGHKGNQQKDELGKGIQYIIKNINIPTFIIKELPHRKDKEGGRFVWLICLVKNYGHSYKAFNYVLDYIDPEKDLVIGYHTALSGYKVDEQLKADFEGVCASRSVQNYVYQVTERDNKTPISDVICELINFGQVSIDFCVMGHNRTKYSKIEESPAVNVIRKAQTNIIFYS